MLDQCPDDFNRHDIGSQGRIILIQRYQFERHIAGCVQTFRTIFSQDQFLFGPAFRHNEITRLRHCHRIKDDPVAILKDRLHGIARYLQRKGTRRQVRMGEEPAQRVTRHGSGSLRTDLQCLIGPISGIWLVLENSGDESQSTFRDMGPLPVSSHKAEHPITS